MVFDKIMFGDLGNSADTVAQSLQRQGIKGVRSAVRFLNPIVVHASTKMDGVTAISVYTGSILRVTTSDGKRLEFQLPQSVIDFLVGFNNGQYPELELTLLSEVNCPHDVGTTIVPSLESPTEPKRVDAMPSLLMLQQLQGNSVFTGLGKNADDIAKTLKSLEIHGVRNTVRNLNPIVRYAERHWADAMSIDVMSGSTLRIVMPGWETEEIPLPQCVMSFLDAFNHGAYPSLETAN